MLPKPASSPLILVCLLLLGGCAAKPPSIANVSADEGDQAIDTAISTGAALDGNDALSYALQQRKAAENQKDPALQNRLLKEATIAAQVATAAEKSRTAGTQLRIAEQQVKALRVAIYAGGQSESEQNQSAETTSAQDQGSLQQSDLVNLPPPAREGSENPERATAKAIAAATAIYDRISQSKDVAAHAASELALARQAKNDLDNHPDAAADWQYHFAWSLAQQSKIAELTAATSKASTQTQTAQQEIIRLQSEQRALTADQARRDAERRLREAELAAARAQAEAKTANEALAAARKLEQHLQGLQVGNSSRGLTLTLDESLFASGESVLSQASAETLDRLAAFLNEYPNRRLLIEGFTDSVGDRELNQRLSADRANAVRDALLQREVAANRISTIGYGEAWPVASNSSAAGRALNRRVEIIISQDSQQILPRY